MDTLTFTHSRPRLKKHSPNLLSRDIWLEIQALFWRDEVPWMPENVLDFFEPVEIECTKRGVELRGGLSFLPGARCSPDPRYGFSLCLARPRFTTLDRVKSLTVWESSFEDGFIAATLM
ncbi:MAG: hypothetical protein JWM59_3941 [Verrucomicrobiales bacterium]|nr:hypothetical protein [Verrucomicrobiales bacterium]